MTMRSTVSQYKMEIENLVMIRNQLQQQVEGPFPLFHLNLNVAALWMMLYKKDKQDFSGACRVGTLIHVMII